jgi:hypothetical protein
MPTPLLQPSFAGGELAPALWGRVDLDRYGIGARSISNWIVRPYGGIETRPGTKLVAAAKFDDKPVLLLPFVISEDLAYVVELGHLYARFHYRGGLLTSGGLPVEVVMPYTETELPRVRFTQSADTMFLVHPLHQPRMLKRTGASSFVLQTLVPREGPFRNINSNESLLVAASAKTGTTTLTTNFDLFTSGMVGALFYVEQKALGQIKPWVQGERTGAGGLAVGALRRSEGKVYRATTVTSAGAPPNYTETGNVRPTHEVGREWDGPGDTRTFDTINYVVGVEWEYLHSGYGVVELTQYVNARNAVGIVRRTLPDGVVGGIGTPANTWTLSGNGATKVFSIPGAASLTQGNYTVVIDGAPLQPDPNYVPPSPGGGGFGGGSPPRGRDDTGPIYVP